MAAIIMETAAWAEAQFGSCALGDRRRNKRMVKFARQVATRPDGSTPEQTESWADCKSAYRRRRRVVRGDRRAALSVDARVV